MVCTNQADMTGRLPVGSLAFECRIMHYLIVRILLSRSSNLAQVFEEDLIIMWVFLTGRQIDWAHLVIYRMHRALRSNAPLPYPHLITLFCVILMFLLTLSPLFMSRDLFLSVLVWFPPLDTAKKGMVLGWRRMLSHRQQMIALLFLLLRGMTLHPLCKTF